MHRKCLLLAIFLVGCAHSETSHEEPEVRQTFNVLYLDMFAPKLERDIRYAVEGIGMEVVEVRNVRKQPSASGVSEYSWVVKSNHPQYVAETIQNVPGVVRVVKIEK